MSEDVLAKARQAMLPETLRALPDIQWKFRGPSLHPSELSQILNDLAGDGLPHAMELLRQTADNAHHSNVMRKLAELNEMLPPGRVVMTDDEITQMLFVRQDPVPADLAMVFASANEVDLERRTRRAVELYQGDYVAKLLVTGGGVLAQLCPEAKRMVEIAREHGVPDSDLLVEDRSGNTFENVKLSVELLQERGLLDKLTVVLLVSSEWHMRRVYLTTKRYFPTSVRFVCCPTCEGCNRENWTKSDACRKEVSREALLLKTFLETGAI